MTITDEMLAELEDLAFECNQHGGNLYEPRHMAAFPEYSCDQDFVVSASHATITALTAELRRLRAENAELECVVKDVRWRVADTTDQLQAYSHNGDRLYGLDEWSVPIRNLNIAISMLEKATQ